MLTDRNRWFTVVALVTILSLAAVASRAAVNPVVQPQNVNIKALPDLAVSMQAPAFTLGQACNTGGPAIIFHVTVRNQGIAPSAAIAQAQAGVMIQTSMTNGHSGSVWSVASALPAISAHGSVNLDVALAPLATSSAMEGAHVFSVMVNPIGVVKELSTANNFANTTVDVPKGFCAHRISLTPTMLQHTVLKPPPQQSKTLAAQGPGSLSNLSLPTYDTLDFKVATGSDNLRGDSTAEADISFPDGTSAVCPLKGQNDDEWANGSTHEVPCKLSNRAETLPNIAKATINIYMKSCQCSFGENTDNWNLEQFWMGAYQSGSNVPALCAFSAGGDPLVRLKPNNIVGTGGIYGYGTFDTGVKISDYPSHC